MKKLNIPQTHNSLTKFRVRYVETDAMGIVHHSAYLAWFEMGRADLGRKIGFPYSDIEKHGFYYPVTEVFCSYKNSACYDDEVIVKTWIHTVRSRSFIFGYEIYNLERLLVTGYTKHIVINRNGKVTRLPENLFLAYKNFDTDLLG